MSRFAPPRTPGPVRTTAFAAVLALAAGSTVPRITPEARADASAVPEFADPTRIDHPLHPVVPGALKVFAGRDEGVAKTVVETHLAETRTFSWDGAEVACRIVEERTFEAGVVISTERIFYAQAADGSVWMFGEVEDGIEDDPLEPNGWVVGAVAPTDPEGTVSVPAPALAFPGSPAAGDQWIAESVNGVEKTVRVLSEGLSVPGPAGRLSGAVRVLERESGDRTPEHVWYVPGCGAVRTASRGERMSLQASTIGLRR